MDLGKTGVLNSLTTEVREGAQTGAGIGFGLGTSSGKQTTTTTTKTVTTRQYGNDLVGIDQINNKERVLLGVNVGNTNQNIGVDSNRLLMGVGRNGNSFNPNYNIKTGEIDARSAAGFGLSSQIGGVEGKTTTTTTQQYRLGSGIQGNESDLGLGNAGPGGLTMGLGGVGDSAGDVTYSTNNPMDLGVLGATASSTQIGTTGNTTKTTTVQKITTTSSGPLLTNTNIINHPLDYVNNIQQNA